jgi:hypothetical protein
MEKIFLLIALFFFGFVQQVGAHAEGLTPFLRINGEYPEVNQIQKEAIVPSSFSVPEDVSKQKFIIREEIAFTIDTSVLSNLYSEEVLQTITFEWDFGDGTTGQGTEVKHTYSQMGSKVLTIYADFNDPEVTFAKQPIESVQIDVLPSKEYILPEPKILVDRRELGLESDEVNMQNSITFEADIKNKPSTDIASYTWDFGEGGKSNEKKAVHRYTTDPAIVTPVLKVTDKNGFTVYTFGMLTNGKNTEGYTFATNTVGTIILWAQALILVVGVTWFIVAVRKKKHTKRA